MACLQCFLCQKLVIGKHCCFRSLVLTSEQGNELVRGTTVVGVMQGLLYILIHSRNIPDLEAILRAKLPLLGVFPPRSFFAGCSAASSAFPAATVPFVGSKWRWARQSTNPNKGVSKNIGPLLGVLMRRIIALRAPVLETSI